MKGNMLRLIIVLCVVSKAISSNIVAKGSTSVTFNHQASFTCTLSDSSGVLQVTWQRLFKDNSVETLATFSKRFGDKVVDSHVGKVFFTEASLSSTSIVVNNVTLADEACYICFFNVYPGGSKREQTCLAVQGISQVKAEIQPLPNPDTLGQSRVITCSATGKPTPSVRWETDSRNYNISKGEVINSTDINDDGTETTTSNLTLRLSQLPGKYVTCIVRSGGMVKEERIYLPEYPSGAGDVASSVNIPVTLISLFIVIAIAIGIVIIVWRCKRQRKLNGYKGSDMEEENGLTELGSLQIPPFLLSCVK